MKSSCAKPRLWMATVLLLAGSLVVPAPAVAELKQPRPTDRWILQSVAVLLQREHIARHKLDDEISQRAFKMFIDALDPNRLYFLQADIDEFEPLRRQIDDLVTKGDMAPVYRIFNRFLERIDQRVQVAQRWLDAKHDFTVREEFIVDREDLPFARTVAELDERWRKRIKYDLLNQKLEGKSLAEARETLRKRYRAFARRMHQTDGDELLEMFLNSVTNSLDPHTSYLSPSTLTNFEISMRLELEGIGASLRQDEDGVIRVVKIVPGGAADKDGRLKPKDQIIAVGQGEDGPWVDVVNMKLSDAVKLIRGKRGTVVRLKVIPAAGGEPRVYKITRAKIELKDSEARGEVITVGRKPSGTPYRIGVIDLPSFYLDMQAARLNLPDYKSSSRDVRKILQQFRRQGVDAVVMDLRRNGGGSLSEAVALTGLFIDRGPVVQIKDADGQVELFEDTEPGVAWSGPLVVLVSKFSASASEIFAGAIQDYRRGLVVGDHATHGKGTVQVLMDLSRRLFRFGGGPKLGALKLTIQQFYLPGGNSTQLRGVLSDIELPSITTHLEIGERDLDYALKFDQVRPAAFRPLNLVTPQIVALLRQKSAQRVAASPEFQKELQRIAHYKKQKERKAVPLNEQEFMALRKQDTKLEDIFNEEDQQPEDGHVVKRDYYLNEVLAITVDYLKLLQAQPN